MALVDESGVELPLVADLDGELTAQGPFPVIRGFPTSPSSTPTGGQPHQVRAR